MWTATKHLVINNVIRQDTANFQLLTFFKFVNYTSSSLQSVAPLAVSLEDMPNLQKVVVNTLKILC